MQVLIAHARPSDQPRKPERQEPPEYTVYKSRQRLCATGFRKPELSGLGAKLGAKGDGGGGVEAAAQALDARRRGRLVAAVAEVGRDLRRSAGSLLSFLAFAISAQIQKWQARRRGRPTMLDGNPFMLGGPQTILVLGTDVRSGAFAGPDEAETENCIEAVTSGRPTRQQLQATAPTARTRSC